MSLFMTLHDKQGNRLYLNAAEREAFAEEAAKAKRSIKCLCLILLYTGCRLSEALQITPRRIDLDEKNIALRSLKKRQDPKTGEPRIIFRSVPVPSHLIDTLDSVFGIREIQQRGKGLDMPLLTVQRAQAWKQVKDVMTAAAIPDGAHKTAKGLRHAYGIHAMRCGVQLNILQKWMGHADMKTTAIYADAIGAEEREIAQRMWK